MDNAYLIATAWIGLASLVSIRLGISVGLLEIALGCGTADCRSRSAPSHTGEALHNPLLKAESCAVAEGPVTAGDSAHYARNLTLRAQRIGLGDSRSPALTTELTAHRAAQYAGALPVPGFRGISIGTGIRCELNEQLVDDLRARRPGGIERLLDEYGRLLQGVAFHILRSHHDAEEVVIDTMVTAWERIGTLRDPTALRPWLLSIATRKALGRRRRSQRVHELLLGDVDPAIGAFDSEHVALGEALGGLPPRMRACLSLHYYAGLSVAETAAALGVSPNTVKFHLKAGLERLRTALEVAPPRGMQP